MVEQGGESRICGGGDPETPVVLAKFDHFLLMLHAGPTFVNGGTHEAVLRMH
jgi:hypothetical protein